MKKFFLFIFCFFSYPVFSQPNIIATYPPIQSLVSQITDGVYPVQLLQKSVGKGHHNVELKPSQIKILKSADVIFWVSPLLENYMPHVIEKVNNQALSIPLMENNQLKLLASPSHRSQLDPHFWLNVDNAIETLKYITQKMSDFDPDNAPRFEKNKQKAIIELSKLKTLKKPIPQRFMALHDGFQYFFKYFNIDGSVLSIEPEDITTPQAVKHFTQVVDDKNPACIIIEPSLSNKQKDKLRLRNYRLIVLDAFGWNIDNGPTHYTKLIQYNLNKLRKCRAK